MALISVIYSINGDRQPRISKSVRKENVKRAWVGTDLYHSVEWLATSVISIAMKNYENYEQL
jgi:hypothetical protein